MHGESMPSLTMWDKIIKIAPEQLSSAAVGVTATLLLLLLPTLFLLWTRRPLKQPPAPSAVKEDPVVAATGNGQALPRKVEEELNGVVQSIPPLPTNGEHRPLASSCCNGVGTTCACANSSTSTDGHESSNPAGKQIGPTEITPWPSPNAPRLSSLSPTQGPRQFSKVKVEHTSY